MAELARRRGIRAAQALGERLPFRSGEFDYLLLVTVICFVESPQKQLREARRVLRYGGRAIVAFIGRERDVSAGSTSHKASATSSTGSRVSPRLPKSFWIQPWVSSALTMMRRLSTR
jgi:ubiquinone/menaquinone biosynthesis C-methylase UbiE